MRRTVAVAAMTAATVALSACSGGEPSGGDRSGRAAASQTATPKTPAQPQSVPTPDPDADLYLALGDSLAAGYQPGLGDNKTGGYVGQVYSAQRSAFPRLELVNLGCSGETSSSLIGHGKCTYPAGAQNQLDAAQKLMRSSGRTKLVTLDVGANDVQNCAGRGGTLDVTCLEQGLRAVATNLPRILKVVRAAAGPSAQIVVLNYYNPFLALWAANNKPLAQQSQTLQKRLNDSIAAAATSGNARVADVAAAFKSTDWRLQTTELGKLPANVAMVCTYTWICTRTDIHANDGGYALIAKTVNALVSSSGRAAS